MKNKLLSLTLLTIMILGVSSCATSRGYGRKGYGCPSTAKAPINGTVVEKTNS
jgi:hypothetical protein